MKNCFSKIFALAAVCCGSVGIMACGDGENGTSAKDDDKELSSSSVVENSSSSEEPESSSDAEEKSSSSVAEELSSSSSAEAVSKGLKWTVSLNEDVEYGKLVDERDDHEYRTVTIGSQVWMAENLNYKEESYKNYCYDNKEVNCSVAGRLYTWKSALRACPSDWHLPSREEWQTLLNEAGEDAAEKLKSSTGWSYSSGTDALGFGAYPTGYRHIDGDFYQASGIAWFWAEDQFEKTEEYYSISIMGSIALRNENEYYGFSVRCIKD